MSTLEHDISDLKEFISLLISVSRQYSTSKLVDENLSISTVNRFKQRTNDILSISCLSLKLIARKLDKFDVEEHHYYKTLKKKINAFVNKHILIDKDIQLIHMGISHNTLQKFKDKSLNNSYYISTLVKHSLNLRDKHTRISK